MNEVKLKMDVLCFGSIIADYRRDAEISVAKDTPIKIVDEAVKLVIGGILIVGMTMKQMGFDVGLMGYVGNDIIGYGLKEYLKSRIGLNVEAVSVIEAATSTSFIQLTAAQRYIEHSPGANAQLLPGKAEIAFVEKYQPSLMAIGYTGILPRLDADSGNEMARWIKTVKSKGVLVALDTHTVPPYQMLTKPVALADIFICNEEEGCGITGSSSGRPSEIIAQLWSKFLPKQSTVFRLIGIAYAHGVQLAYGRGADFVSKWIENPQYGTFEPADLTGAGDYFRAGLYAFVIKHKDEFKKGDFDMEKAGLNGHLTAAKYLKQKSKKNLKEN